MARSSFSVAVASIVGSFVVYAACGGVVSKGGAQVPSASGSATSVASAPTTAPTALTGGGEGGCACAAPKVVASLSLTTAAGEDKIALDPLDASAHLDVEYVRGPGGKKLAAVTAVVRAFRSDVAAERLSTLSIRVIVPENGGAAATKDVEAFFTTWGANTALPPRALATVAKSTLTATLVADAVELKGSLVLKDAPTGKSILVDKLSVKKTGVGVLPVRSGVLVAP
jgi:hypothetical protein